jgi:N-acyl-D-amino-acid deacylase
MTTIFATLLALVACQQPAPTDEPVEDSGRTFDIVLTGGTVVDGLGNPGYRADVGIKGERIIAISSASLNSEDADTTIDVSGLVVAPGFIDNHAHIQTTIHEHPLAENFTRQGITTIIAGLHSGDQPWPLDEYASSLEVAPNVGFFAGHTPQTGSRAREPRARPR